MTTTTLPTTTMTAADVRQQLDDLLGRVAGTGMRVIVEHDGAPIAAIVSANDPRRLNVLDAEWEQDFSVFDEIGAAFADASPEEIERETAKAVAEVRAEMRAEREAARSR